MKRSTAGVDRFITLLIAAVLIVTGLLTILWRADVSWADTVFAHAEPRWYRDAPQQPWWDWVLLAATIVTLLLGLWLLLANLRPNRVGTVNLDGTDPLGALAATPLQVGTAAASLMERKQEVRSASASAVVDRGQRTLRITVKSDPDVPLHDLRNFAAISAAAIDTALEGGEVVTQFFVQYEPAGTVP